MVADNTDQPKFTVFAIAGYAGSGKDTLADNIARNIPKGMAYCKIKMADALKQALQAGLDNVGVKFDVMTEDRGEKEQVRPLLVEFGRFCRSRDKGVFANKVTMLLDDICDVADVAFISDMRYINEYEILESMCSRRKWKFVPIIISSPGVGAANDEEAGSISELMMFKGDEISEIDIPHGEIKAFDGVAKVIVESVYQ